MKSRSAFTLKVAPKALRVPLSLWDRAGVREATMATATIMLWGGAGAMVVSAPSWGPSANQLGRGAPG